MNNIQSETFLARLKREAIEYRASQAILGRSIKHGGALEEVAHLHGYRHWNVARAAAVAMDAETIVAPVAQPEEPDPEELPRALTKKEIEAAVRIFALRAMEPMIHDEELYRLERFLDENDADQAMSVAEERIKKSDVATASALQSKTTPYEYISLIYGGDGCYVVYCVRQVDGQYLTYTLDKWKRWTTVGQDGDDHHCSYEGADFVARLKAHSYGIAYISWKRPNA